VRSRAHPTRLSITIPKGEANRSRGKIQLQNSSLDSIAKKVLQRSVTMKKRIVAGVGLGLGLLASLLAGAQSSSISFWVRTADQGFTEPLVKAYNARGGTQIKLTVIPQDDFVSKFGTAVAGGAGPDVVSVDLIFLPAFAKSGQMTDMTDFQKSLPFAKSLSPSHVRLSTFEGKVYAVPFSAESSILLYNKDLFKRAGLNTNKPPKNWAEIEAYAKKITALGDGKFG
jgi:multiple sugar transport system substrate-binding protein